MAEAENEFSTGARGAPFVGKVVGKGKVTVPKNVRDLLGLKEGDYAEFIAVRRMPGAEPVLSDPPSEPQ